MQTVTSKDGTTIAYDCYGTGHAVILIGGAFQHRAIHPGMTELAQTLGRQFKGIYYDRRGRGDSTDTPPYAVEREVEDLQAILQAVGGSASLFGMSSGGALAFEAVRSGLPIRRLAIYEPPYYIEEHLRPEAEEYTHGLNALLAAGHQSEAAAFAMTRMGAPAEVVAEMRQTPIWATFERMAPTLAYDNRVMGDGFVPVDRLGSVRVPALVLVGGETFEFMRPAAEALVKALPNGRIRVLPGQNHNFDPAVLGPVLLEFFAGIS